jgi:cyclic-di-AMP phosphodiesterase PgpH
MRAPDGLQKLGGWLSGTPARVWPDGVAHHGARLLLLLLVAFAVHALFPVVPAPDLPVLEKGTVAPRDILAQATFPIYKAPSELEQERQQAAAGVPPFFEYDANAIDAMLQRVDAFFARIDSAAMSTRGLEEQKARIGEVLRSSGLQVTDQATELMRSARQRRLLKGSLDRAIRAELPRGIARASDLDDAGGQQIRYQRGDREVMVQHDSVLTQSSLFDRAASYLPSAARPGLSDLQRLVLIRFFEPTLRYDREATDQARRRAREAVPLVKDTIQRGAKIIGAHEQVREPDLERLRAYRDYLASIGRLGGGVAGPRVLGSLMFDVMLLSIFGLLLFFFRPAVYHNFRHTVLIASLIVLLLAVASIVGHRDLPDQLIPIAMPALVVAALWDGRLALNMSLVLALLIAGQSPFGGMSVLFTMAVGGAAAALSVRVVRRRAQTWVFASIITLAYAAAAVALGLLRSLSPPEILHAALWGAVNATACALIAMGLLPLFEAFTRITTDQTLLELSDLNQPLLRRLSREAPGTFSHSLSVANLAEAAARAIGANALLARVGVYFHDIGKLGKPQYFIENQPAGRNPHDKLKPASSAAIVRNHVYEGLKLAEENKLPDCIRAFIAEHHGTQSISFFYDRAREEDPEGNIDAGQFAYPGPRPQSRETAIALLADSVESAARVLPDPTPDRIHDLVERIVGTKMRLNQLDDAPLTLRDLNRIREAFAAVLIGMYHQRIDYPPAPAERRATAAVATTQTAPPG